MRLAPPPRARYALDLATTGVVGDMKAYVIVEAHAVVGGRVKRAALGLGALLALGACGGGSRPVLPDAAPGADAPADAAELDDVATGADQDLGPSPPDAREAPPPADPTAVVPTPPIMWGACAAGSGLDDCALVSVPRDYDQPAGPQLSLFVGRKRATQPAQRIGTLFTNPGGPGAPGASGGFLPRLWNSLSDQVKARFDLVSWDPRGVARSPAVDCQANPSLVTIQETYDHSAHTTQRDLLRSLYGAWVSTCGRNVPLLPYVGTAATVSDLELLRRSVGDGGLSYLGFSYGTSIGLYYLVRYPDRVRAMVLDGVDTIWGEDLGPSDQDDAFDAALAAFFDWCAQASAADCPFARDAPARATAFDALAGSIRAHPLPAGGAAGPLNIVMFQWAVGSYLYAQDDWPALGAALEQARGGDGAPLYRAAAGYLGAVEDPFYAITCGDGGPVSAADVDAMAAQLGHSRLAVPYAALGCVGWPDIELTPAPGLVGDIPPVVLIGNTGDPATPYRWATAVAARLPRSTLLTSRQYTHTAYASGDPCIDDPVDAYLVAGAVPTAGLICAVPLPRATTTPLAWAGGVRSRPPRRPARGLAATRPRAQGKIPRSP